MKMRALLIGVMGLMGLMCGCERRERVHIRPEAAAEIARNMGKAKEEELLTQRLQLADQVVANRRKAVARATAPGEVALAVEDLRRANDEVEKLEAEIRKLD